MTLAPRSASSAATLTPAIPPPTTANSTRTDLSLDGGRSSSSGERNLEIGHPPQIEPGPIAAAHHPQQHLLAARATRHHSGADLVEHPGLGHHADPPAVCALSSGDGHVD